MLRVNFYELNKIEDNKLSFAVIMARYKEQWIFVRHKDRTTWEIPGGHREQWEDIYSTARRELFEESGAVEFNIFPVAVYSVESENSESFGQLFYAEVNNVVDLPDSEIGEVKLFDTMPDNLTYPLIQPCLFAKGEEMHKALDIKNFKAIQKVIFDNKVKKGFNTTNVELEFCLTNGELAEAFEAYNKRMPTVGEELADVAIYLYGLAEILGFDLNKEILKKVHKNKGRIYKNIDGINVRIGD